MFLLNRRNLFFAILFPVLTANFAFGQQAVTTAQVVPLDLPVILDRAEEQTANYQEEFKNLLGQETKTFESFDKKGKSKKQVAVESNFIVYQSPKDAAQVAEIRWPHSFVRSHGDRHLTAMPQRFHSPDPASTHQLK